MEIVKYQQHGNDVFVMEFNKGWHRENCLCFQCDKLNIDNREENCPIASELYAFDVKHSVTTPVWECPSFCKKEE